MITDELVDNIVGRKFSSKREILAFQEKYKFSRYSAPTAKENHPEYLQKLGFLKMQLRCRCNGTYKPRGDSVKNSIKTECPFQLQLKPSKDEKLVVEEKGTTLEHNADCIEYHRQNPIQPTVPVNVAPELPGKIIFFILKFYLSKIE